MENNTHWMRKNQTSKTRCKIYQNNMGSYEMAIDVWSSDSQDKDSSSIDLES